MPKVKHIGLLSGQFGDGCFIFGIYGAPRPTPVGDSAAWRPGLARAHPTKVPLARTGVSQRRRLLRSPRLLVWRRGACTSTLATRMVPGEPPVLPRRALLACGCVSLTTEEQQRRRPARAQREQQAPQTGDVRSSRCLLWLGHISLVLLELKSSGRAGPGARVLGAARRQQN